MRCKRSSNTGGTSFHAADALAAERPPARPEAASSSCGTAACSASSARRRMRMVALSGSIAHLNLDPDGDLDLHRHPRHRVWCVNVAVIVRRS
jgi:hypothetical protein